MQKIIRLHYIVKIYVNGFSKPIAAAEERREIVDSLIGTLENFPFLEQPDVKFELSRNWELMDL